MRTGNSHCCAAVYWLLLLCLPADLGAQVPDFSRLRPQAAFAATASSPPAFGLWFTEELGGRVLNLRIVIHYPDRDVVSSSGRWAWNPATSQVSYRTVDRGGGLTEGVTTFPDAAVFRTVATRYSQRGPPSNHRDDNLLVSADVHRNETFEETAQGWVSRGIYEWIRTR